MLSYIHWDPDPTIVNASLFSLRWYSLLFAAGFVMGYMLLKQYFQKADIPVKLLDKLAFYIVLGTVAGARLGHCLFYDFAYYRNHLAEVILPFTFQPRFKFTGYEGLASHGGVIGILIAMWFYCKKNKMSFLWVADRLATVVPLAGCCIRLGNLMNSEIIGKPSDLPWAFVFERIDNVPRHPSQLYEVLVYLLIAAVVYRISLSGQINGYLFGWFLVLVFSARFLIEFAKEDQATFEAGMFLNMGQLLSIPLIICGVMILLRANTSVKNRAYNN